MDYTTRRPATYRTSNALRLPAVDILSTEWRWVFAVGILMVLIAFMPLLWAAVNNGEWRFMGVLHNYLDGASYLSKMRVGIDGGWLVEFRHTPTLHEGAFIQTLYPLLGHLSRLISMPPLILFHLARAGAALIMVASLYQFAAVVWARVSARRTFLVFALLGSGVGWLLGPLTANTDFPDFTLLPEAYPFFSTLVNVHFPLTLAALALLASACIFALQPGSENTPSWSLMVLAAGLSAVLAVLYPQALLPLTGALLLSIALLFFRHRQWPHIPARLLVAIALPALPFAVYLAWLIRSNPTMALWNSQNVTGAPNPLIFAAGFAWPLLIASPALWRAARHLEREGDAFMLLWLVAMVVTMYLPTNVQRRFAVGMMIPLAYFATRAWSDVWLPRLSRTARRVLIPIGLLAMGISPLAVLLLPALAVNAPEVAEGVYLDADYTRAYQWLDARTDSDDVVLAAPVVSAWLPGYAGARVAYGHPYETLNAQAQRAAVEAWYRGDDCTASSAVRYVLVGPSEQRLATDGAASSCLEDLRVMTHFGDVTVYAP